MIESNKYKYLLESMPQELPCPPGQAKVFWLFEDWEMAAAVPAASFAAFCLPPRYLHSAMLRCVPFPVPVSVPRACEALPVTATL